MNTMTIWTQPIMCQFTKMDIVFKRYLKRTINKNNTFILIAEKENNIFGFITFEKATVDYFDTNIVEYGEVLELFVDLKYRKIGIGEELLLEVGKFFKNQEI